MATFKKNLSNDSRYSITLTVTETGTSIANNTSNISYSLTATKSSGSGYYTSSTTNPIKITINGEVLVNKKVAYDFTGSTPKTITLASGTKNGILHEADGTKTIQCSGYFKDAENSLGSATASGSLILTTLHKAPEPLITNIFELNTTLTGYGVADNNFVAYVSKKQFVIDAITYDDAEVNRFAVSNGSLSNAITHTTTPTTLNLDFANQPITIDNNEVPITTFVIDDMNAEGTATTMYSNYIPYFKPTLVASNLTSKRAGQLTGDVNLVASGTYYNGSVGSLTISPKVYYRYREITTPESSWGAWTQINSASASDGSWNINATISSVFNYQKTYEIEVYCTDNLIEANNSNVNNTTLTIPTYITKVLVGEATWTEYKDRVDFKKITIQNVNPFETTTGNLTITKTSGNSTCTGTYYKYGKIVMVNISISTTGTTASGGNIFVGTIDNITPAINTNLIGYHAAKPIMAAIGTNGGITIRNASPDSVGNNSNMSIRGTFITQ